MISFKLSKYLQRLLYGVSIGIFFQGTNRFKVPSRIRYHGKIFPLVAPDEDGCRFVFRDIFLDDEYGLREMEVAPRTIIDIGANVGFFSLWSGVRFPGAVIHAYEPNPRLQGHLSGNLCGIGATIHQEGIGLRCCHGRFDDRDESILGTCAPDEDGGIAITSLSDALTRIGGTCDLLKLDCEGCEWWLLDDEDAFRKIGQVRMEYHILDASHSVERLVERFQEMGYGLTRLRRSENYGHAWFTRNQ